VCLFLLFFPLHFIHVSIWATNIIIFFVSVAGIPHQGVKERDHPVNKMAMEYLELVK